MTDSQNDAAQATQAGVDIWKSLPRSLQGVLLFAALGGLPMVTQLVTIVPRVGEVESRVGKMEAQIDTLTTVLVTVPRLRTDVTVQQARTDSVNAALRDANSKLTYILCQDRFRALPNAREVCQSVQEEVEMILRRGTR